MAIFSDIQNHWAQLCISQLSERKLIRGYPDGSFRPNASLTRVEFAALIYQVFPSAVPIRSAITFTDVPANHWAIQAIQAVYRAGFLSGYPDRTFRLNLPISRVQALIALASGLKYGTPPGSAQLLKQYFDDAAQIPNYAITGMAAATVGRLVVNYPKVRQLNPNQNTTRGEVAAFISQALIQAWQVSAVPQYVAGTPISRGIRSAVGNVSAKYLPSQLRLKITRQGQLSDVLLPNLKPSTTSRAVGVLVQDLDKDGELEVLVDFYDPEHRGFVSYVYYYQPELKQYAYIEQVWGNFPYQLQDVNRDNSWEFISGDSGFEKLSPNSLDSAVPIAVWKYQQRQFLDVTRLYKDQIRTHANQLWQEFLNRQRRQLEVKAILAAYLADKYLLNEGKEGLQQLRQADQSSDREAYLSAVVDALAANNYLPLEFQLQPQFEQIDDFTEGLARVKLDGKWGFIDTEGNLAIQPQFIGVDNFSKVLLPKQPLPAGEPTSSLQAWVRVGNKYGYINDQGQLIIQPQFDATGSAFSEGLLAVRIGDKWGYIDQLGKVVISPQFDGANNFSEGLARVLVRDQYGYIDKAGKLIIQPQFNYADSFISGVARVGSGDKLGYINNTGKFLVQAQFDYADAFQAGIARVWKDKKWGYINKNGNFVIQPQYDYADIFREGVARVQKGGQWGYIDQTGKVVIPLQYEAIDQFSQGLAIVKVGNQYGYVDSTGKLVIQPQFEQADEFCVSSNGILRRELARVVIDNQYGYIDQTGNRVIQPQFDHADSFCTSDDGGLARVKIGQKYGYIDNTGKLVIGAKFDQAHPFCQGLARVKMGKQWGYIYRSGNFVIPPQFDAADNFGAGIAKVRQQGKWGYIRHPLS